VKSEAVHG